MSEPNLPEARRRARVGLALVVCGLLASAVLATRPVGAAPPAPTPEAAPALEWLSAELVANAGSLPGFTPGSSDWGLTADAVLAFVAAGRRTDAAAATATDLVAENAETYTTWAPSMPEVRVAGATAKVVLTLRSMGRDATAGGVDLESELRSLMVSEGAELGRFVDRVPDPTWDSSNGFAQSLSILALALTPEGVPGDATSYLLAQQCPGGGFRLNYLGRSGCASDSEADTDASAVALQALLAAPRSQEVVAAAHRVGAWLLSRQADDGSFGGTGPTADVNTNSTGLIAQALRAAGLVEPADRAAGWISQTSQLDADKADGTPAADDAGAIAYNPASLAVALTDGITDQTADQWRRATTQAVLAFGLAPFGPQDNEPLPPPTPTSTTTTTTSTTSTTAPATPTTAPSTTSPVATSSTLPPTSNPLVAPPQSDQQTDVLGGVASNSTARQGASTDLALTGSATWARMLGALSLIVAGLVLTAASRRRW